MPAPRGLALTATGACCAIGDDVAACVRALAAGRSGLATPTRALPFRTVVGEVRSELPTLPESHAAWESRVTRLALAAALPVRDTVSRAVRRHGAGRVALLVGTSTGGLDRGEWAQAERRAKGALPPSFDFARQQALGCMVPVLRDALGVKGPSYAVSTACTSGAKVLASAARLIEAGIVDAAVVGGVDVLCLTTLHGFHALGVLAETACRPFARERPGMNLGEGAAFLVVERDAESAVRFLGAGESSDAYHPASPDPTGAGARLAIERALHAAGVSRDEVEHVNAHGTGTLQNDVAESRAIAAALGTHVPVTSTKGYTGHLLGAAGALEAVFGAIAIEHGPVPASLGADPVDGTIEVRVATTSIATRPRVVVSTSLAFAGSNAAIVLGGAA